MHSSYVEKRVLYKDASQKNSIQNRRALSRQLHGAWLLWKSVVIEAVMCNVAVRGWLVKKEADWWAMSICLELL